MLKGELVRGSDRAHGMSSWARLCKFVGARPPVLKGELVRRSDWAHGMSSWARLL